ncbi:CLUMA_CG013852, isoform A [Clunio marinus]|uniref:Mitochondrial basic amino acids transporter n=1 Tax=Clunio marinus TaxID=568069 RepID=A0A1J1IK86_9DIPT|nr:CLUMA_CG013852, isoform A [Clunio marinus]
MALDFVAGCLGGCAGLLVGHPFDTIKVHLQTQDFKNPLYRGTYDCLKKIVQKESINGLYRGMSSPMASISVLNAIVFGVYGNVQRRMSEPDSLFAHFCAGTIAGLSQTFISSPMDLVKSRLQIQNGIPNAIKHKSPFACLNHIWKNEGRHGVFKGFGITIARDVPGFASYFVSFEWMMRKRENPGALYTLLAGGLAGSFSWLISIPMDVIKSRLQVDGMDGKPQYNGAIDCVRKSYKAEGMGFLTRGLCATLIRAFPMNAVCFLVVSYVMKFFDNKNIDVTIVKPQTLAIADSYTQTVIIRGNRQQNDHHKHKARAKYMIFLDGFHEASCHVEMMDLSDELREKRFNNEYFYKMNDGLLSVDLSEDEMKTPLNIC